MSARPASTRLARPPMIRHAVPALLLALAAAANAAPVALLNVSYDVTREFYKDYDAAFAAH